MGRHWIRLLIRLVILSLFYGHTTSKRRDGQLRFVVIGDTGGIPYWPFSTEPQRRLGKELAKVPGVDFFLGVGDNFYQNGVETVDDTRFQHTFESVYNSPSLLKDWYMIAGNHDHLGNISAQILYSKKSSRWNFPHYFYTKVFNIPKSNKTVQIVMFDTVVLCYPHFSYSGIKISIPPQLSSRQMDWLTRTIEHSNASYLIVAGHHPLYSAGWHGSSECLQEKLGDLFENHRVTAYFSGHDHDLQHIKKDSSAVEYFISGAGSWALGWYPNIDILEPNSLKHFHGATLGFLVVTATDKHLGVKFHTLNGNRKVTKYSRLIQPRKATTNNDTKFPEQLREFFKSMGGRQNF